MSCFENALNGTGSFVLVTGKEGIGKSTILSEAGNRLRDRGALVLEGRCRPGLLSYHALLPVARRALDLLCKENISDDLLIPAVNLLEVLEGRAAPVTSIQDPATHRINLFDQMATLLRAASEIRPLVVLVHDIDFADPGTLHLISYLGRVLTGLPELSGGQFRGMLVTNAQRSSAISMDPRWENSVNLVRMSLDGLTAGGVREFLASEEVVSQVLESTSGDPLLLDALISRSVEQVEPMTVLDNLDPSQRKFLGVLAVFGRTLGPETLRLLTGLPHDRLAKSINSLASQGLIEKTVSGGELQIGFARAGDQLRISRHLSDDEKRALHVKIGQYLEGQGDSELESCALHLLDGRSGERAIEAALAAGQRLEISFCFERAADLYEKALSLDPGASVRRALTDKLCSVYEITGQLEQALKHAKRSRTERPGDPEQALRIAHLHLIRGDFSAARSELKALGDQDHEDAALSARILADTAWAQYLAGESEDAITSARQGLEKCGDGNDEDGVKLSLQNTLGKILLEAEEYDQARDMFLGNLEWSSTSGLPAEEVRAMVQLGQICLQSGDYDGADRWYRKARDLACSIGEHRFLGACLQHLGVLAERRRDYGQALELYQDAVVAWKKVGHRSYLAWVGLDLGKLYLRLGDVKRAAAMADLADRISDDEPPLASRINLELLRGRIALHECRYQEAAERFHLARDLAGSAGQVERETRSLLDLVALHLEQNAPEDALTLLVEEIGRPNLSALLLKTLIMWARVEIDMKQISSAKAHLAEALELSEHLQDPESSWQIRFLMAIVARRQGRRAEARRLLKEAASGELAIRRRIPREFQETLVDQPLRLALRQALSPCKKDPEHLGGRDLKPACVMESTLSEEAHRRTSFEKIIGGHPHMQLVYDHISKVARTDALILIRGESGTGKELIAEAIHRRSARSSKPLVKVNCGALVESLLLSELFGHERGAFTGAMQRKKGRFEIAHGGTIFLDEIGDISPKTQVALLRVLQNHEFERVGGTASINVDVRIICATNRNLEEMVAQGSFREDLYYRLKGVLLEVPPLRERLEDVSLLSDHFLRCICKERNTEPRSLSMQSEQLLCTHSWPGNVRELENVLRSVSLFSEASVLEVGDFADYPELRAVVRQQAAPRALPAGANIGSNEREADGAGASTHYGQIRARGMSLKEFKKHIEAECINEALGEVGGNITKAAKLLGMKRPRLSQLIKEHGLSVR